MFAFIHLNFFVFNCGFISLHFARFDTISIFRVCDCACGYLYVSEVGLCVLVWRFVCCVRPRYVWKSSIEMKIDSFCDHHLIATISVARQSKSVNLLKMRCIRRSIVNSVNYFVKWTSNQLKGGAQIIFPLSDIPIVTTAQDPQWLQYVFVNCDKFSFFLNFVYVNCVKFVYRIEYNGDYSANCCIYSTIDNSNKWFCEQCQREWAGKAYRSGLVYRCFAQNTCWRFIELWVCCIVFLLLFFFQFWPCSFRRFVNFQINFA